MFKKFTNEEQVISVIAKGAKVNGIETSTDLSVAGIVDGDVIAKNVTVFGEITGNIKATGKVVLTKGSSVLGPIICQAIEIEEGTHFSNTLKVGVSGATEVESEELESEE